MNLAEWLSDFDGIWRYVTADGKVLITMVHDHALGQYKSNGVPVGANWGDAKAKCEAQAAPKRSRK